MSHCQMRDYKSQEEFPYKYSSKTALSYAQIMSIIISSVNSQGVVKPSYKQ